MKKLLLLFLMFVSCVYAIEIDEYKTDVYFANGILTEHNSSVANTLLLRDSIKVKRYSGSTKEMKKHIGKVKEAYNETHFGGFGDLIESLLQKLSHQEAFDDVVNILTLGLFETSHDRNLETQVNAYKDSIKSGHKVLVVAHSQGNLFTFEARGRLIDESKDAWMDKYFQVISIASPAMFSISNDTPLISWDNDLVAWLGIYNGSVVNNDIRRIVWEGVNPDSSTTTNTQVPSSNYVKRSQVNNIYENEWKATESVLGKFDSVVHAFTFYMGEDLADGKILNPFGGSKLHTDKAKILIMNAVDEKITYLEGLESQWKVKKETGCICKKKYIEVTHQFDPSEMDTLLKGQDIKNFSAEGEGKIYTVDSTYVRAGYGGESIEKLDEGEVCLRLKSSDATLGEIKGKRQGDIPKAFDGAIDMYLAWNYECDIDMNLEMTASPNSRGAPYIRQDIKDIEGYGKEHTYIDTVYHTYPGDHYNFKADGEKLPDSTLDEETLAKDPIEIRALLETPTGSYFKVWEAKAFKQLDLGKFAELDVKEKIIPQWICPALNNTPGWYRPFNGDTKRFQCVSCEKPYTVEWYKPNPKRAGYWKCNRPVVYSGGSGGGGGRTYNQCTKEKKKKTCGCVPCEYIVSGMQKRVENGPVAGADVTIIKASELSSVSPTALWKGKTTDKEDIFKSGLLEIPTDTLQNFEDDVYYVVMAKGGNDIDYDDDMKRDISPVENHGVMHAIIKGSELKLLPFRVNVLTEAIYQVVGEYMGDNYRQTALEENLDVIAKKILSKKLYPADDEPIINYKDVLLWTPAVDKKALYKPYNIYVEPIINRVYADEERYDVSYRFIYEPYSGDAPQLSPVALEIPAGLPDGTIVAALTTQNEKSFASVELEGKYAEHFNVDEKGYLHINKSELIKIGNKYRLQVRAVDGQGNKGGFVSLDISVLVPTNIADPTKSVPMFVSADVNTIYENSEAGTVVAQTYFEDSNQTIEAYRLIGEDNSSFTIDNNGVIYVAQNATIDYEKSKLYSFKVAAKNDVGNESFPVRLSVPIKNRLDTPLFDLVVFEHIEENIPLGSIITTIRTDREGLGAIEKFEILSPHMPFTIDSNGTMYVSDYIDYEQKKQYDFYAIARTKYGNSNKIEVHISIDDQRPEVGVPSLEVLTLSVDENVTSGSKIGQLVLDTGATAIERIALYGEDDNFRVDANGSIYLAEDATLDYETKTRYDLGARALNSRGWGNEVHIVIHVNNIADELPTLENFRKSVEENATAGTVIGKIITSGTSETMIDSFELTGTGNENFTIDVNGTIRVSQSAQLDYESKNSYLLQAIASSTVGSSSEVEVIIYILNVPENPPVLKPLTLSIEENASIGTVVGTVEEDTNAVDAGDSPIISYRLTNTEFINIDSNGTLTLNQDINYLITPLINLQVYATNSAGESNASDINITVQQMLYNGDSTENTLIGSSRDETFDAKGGNDTIQSGGGDDSITGGKGNDIIIDEGGDDSYHYTLGDGNDTMEDHRGEDILYIHGIQKEKCRYEISGRDMLIVMENNETITLKNWVDNDYKIETFMFDDGQSVTVDEFNHPIVKADASIVDLSKLGNTHAKMVVQGFVRPLEGGYDAVDHWVFHYNGGQLIIDMLSELASNGHTYIDIDGDGKQTGLDVYIYLFKKDQNANWMTVRGNDDSSAGTADGSSHSYDSYLSLDLEEGEYMLSVSNYSLSASVALTEKNSAQSYPHGGPYQITFNTALEFSAFPDNANNNLYGSDHYNFYVLRNDLDPYNVDGLRILNPEIFDENGTRSNSMGRAESMENYLSYYPEDAFSGTNTSHELNIVYNVVNQNGIECRSLLSLQIIPDMYMHVDSEVNRDIWATIKEDCLDDLNISKGK